MSYNPPTKAPPHEIVIKGIRFIRITEFYRPIEYHLLRDAKQEFDRSRIPTHVEKKNGYFYLYRHAKGFIQTFEAEKTRKYRANLKKRAALLCN